jgi:MFS family permease
VTGCGLILASFIQVLWQYYTIYVVIAVGLAAVGLVPSQTVVSHWFTRRRGTAMGIVMTGIGLGGMAMVFVASTLNEAYGWRWTYRILGLLVLGIVVPVILAVIRNRPEELGLAPDGVKDSGTGAASGDRMQGLTVKECLGIAPFHLTCLIMALFSVILGGLTMHAIALFRSYGVEEASALWSLTLGVSVAGRIIFGSLSDRVSKKLLLGVSWVLHTLGFASIMMMAGTHGYVWGFVVCYGLALGSFVTLFPLFLGERFGVEHFSKLVGVTGLFQVIGLAVGSVLMGRIYDAAASYDRGVQTMLVISVIALVITALIGVPARTQISVPPETS